RESTRTAWSTGSVDAGPSCPRARQTFSSDRHLSGVQAASQFANGQNRAEQTKLMAQLGNGRWSQSCAVKQRWVSEKCGRWPIEDHLARGHDYDARGNLRHQPHVMRDRGDRSARTGKRRERLKQQIRVAAVLSERRLIQKQPVL